MFKFLDVLNPLWAALGRQPLVFAAIFAVLTVVAFYFSWGNSGTVLAMCCATLMIWRSEQDQPAELELGVVSNV